MEIVAPLGACVVLYFETLTRPGFYSLYWYTETFMVCFGKLIPIFGWTVSIPNKKLIVSMFEYLDKIKILINKLSVDQHEQLVSAAKIVADVIKNDGIIHTIGTGHSQMIGMEMFGRASNLANVNAIICFK